MKQKDLKIEYYKSSGPGGQHKNKRYTAVRITHLASGLSAIGADLRSQAANREVAWARLKKKLAQYHAPKKLRKPTRLPRAVKERILAWKKKQSLKKKLRSERIGLED